MIVFPWIYYGWLLFYKKDTKRLNSASELEIVKQNSIITPNKTDGNDCHFLETEEEKEIQLTKINNHRYNHFKLQILQNPNISIIEKMMILEKYTSSTSIYISDITKGGLWKDWE